MAVVGHAYVVVRALTDKVDADIKNSFSKISKSAEAGGRDVGDSLAKGISSGLGGKSIRTSRDRFREAIGNSVELADNMTRLARTGYLVQAGFGAIAGGISSLIGGLGALGGAALGAASALVAVGSAAITAKVGMSIANFALKGVSQAVSSATKVNGGYSKSLKEIAFDAEKAALVSEKASLDLEKAKEALLRTQDQPANSRARREAELAVKEADLAYRRAREAEKLKGKDQADGGGGSDPYAGLTPSQKEFAKYLGSIRSTLDDLREATAKGFLPLLQTQIEKVIDAKLPDILEEKFNKLGTAVGKAVENFTDIFLAGDNLQDFQDILDDMAKNLPAFGTILGNVFSSFLSIIEAADPLTKKFIGFLEEKTNSFRNFLDAKQATGELEDFFNRAGEIAAGFGTVFGNIFGGLGDIISANFGPGSGGDMILTWLQKTTTGFRDLDAVGLDIYFKGAATNFIAMGEALGGALEIFIEAGSNPAIGEFFNAMDGAALAFKAILDGSIESAPSLGRLLETMIEIVAIFSDSGQVIAFFDTLNYFAEGALQTLRALKEVIDFAGPIFATISAFVLLEALLFKITAVLVGFGVKMVLAVAGAIGPTTLLNIQLALTKLKLLEIVPAAAASGTAMTFALGPVIGTIALVVAGVVALVAAINGIHAANMEKATDGVTRGFKQGADAADLWAQATQATVNGPHKEAINSIEEMKVGMERLAKTQKDLRYAFPSTTAMADSFGAMGRSLADLAVNDLPAAQENFKKFTKEVGFSNSEVQVALNEMDEYKATLIDQADQLGINVRALDGEIDMQKLANFAIGEGEIAQRKANEEKQKAIDKLAEISRGFVDYGDALNDTKDATRKWAEGLAAETSNAEDTWQDYWDGQTLNMDIYLDQLEAQVEAARNWQTNIGLLSGKLDDEVLSNLTDMGEAGAQIVAGLVDGVNDEEEIARLNNIGTVAGETLYKGAQDALDKNKLGFKYVTLPGVTIPTGRKTLSGILKDDGSKNGGFIGFANGGFIKKFAPGGPVWGAGTARSDSIPAMLSNGEYVINARATAQNRELLDSINNNEKVSMAPVINVTVNPSAGMDEVELASMVSRQIASEVRRGTI